MREIFTSGSVGRALGNQRLYLEDGLRQAALAPDTDARLCGKYPETLKLVKITAQIIRLGF
jgi:hypothetical protein